MSDQKNGPWGLDQMMAVAAVRHCLTVYGPMVYWCAQWVRDNWDEFTPHTRLCIRHEVTKALEAEELHRAGPGSGLDNKLQDLVMIRSLWMQKGAV
jgi:hypothetical protein